MEHLCTSQWMSVHPLSMPSEQVLRCPHEEGSLATQRCNTKTGQTVLKHTCHFADLAVSRLIHITIHINTKPNKMTRAPSIHPAVWSVFPVCLATKKKAKPLIRLGRCPGWSESLLGHRAFCWFCRSPAHISSKWGKTSITMLVECPILVEVKIYSSMYSITGTHQILGVKVTGDQVQHADIGHRYEPCHEKTCHQGSPLCYNPTGLLSFSD